MSNKSPFLLRLGAIFIALLMGGCVTSPEPIGSSDIEDGPQSSSDQLLGDTVVTVEQVVPSVVAENRDQLLDLLKEGAVSSAYELYIAQSAQYADDYTVLRQLANGLRGQKRYLDAIAVYESALSSTDDGVEKGDVENYIGLVLHDIGRYQEAVEWIDKALTHHPSDVFRSNRAVIVKKFEDLQKNENTPKDLVVYFLARVSTDTTGRLIQKVSEYVEDGAENIYVFIVSSGGDANAGLATYNYLSSLNVNVVTVNLSLVASAATYFYCAGDERYAYPNSRFLFHGTKISNRELLSKDEYEVNIVTHEILEQSVANLYANCSGLKMETLLSDFLSREGRVITAKDTSKLGFVHAIRSQFPNIIDADVYTVHKQNKNYP